MITEMCKGMNLPGWADWHRARREAGGFILHALFSQLPELAERLSLAWRPLLPGSLHSALEF